MDSHLPKTSIYAQCIKTLSMFRGHGISMRTHMCAFTHGQPVISGCKQKQLAMCIIRVQFYIVLICHSYSKSGLGEYYDWSSTFWLMRQSNAAWMSDIMQQWVGCVQFRTPGVSECNYIPLGHLISLSLQTVRLALVRLPHHQATGSLLWLPACTQLRKGTYQAQPPCLQTAMGQPLSLPHTRLPGVLTRGYSVKHAGLKDVYY